MPAILEWAATNLGIYIPEPPKGRTDDRWSFAREPGGDGQVVGGTVRGALARIQRLDLDRLDSNQTSLAKTMRAALPFPHVVIDHLAEVDDDLLGSFPPFDWKGWEPTAETYQAQKVTCTSLEAIPEPLRQLIDELNGPRFLRWLEVVTGVRRLMPDPYLIGGGLHMSGPGGTLAPHTDFHLHPHTGAFRRVNLILYLEPGWRDEDGGCLQLFDKSGTLPPVKVVPALGRAVIFNTSDRSVHGFPEPVAEGRVRRSIALYFYTGHDGEEFGGLLTTDWRAHGAGGSLFQARLSTYKALIWASRGFAMAAHLANPNQGVSLVREVVRGRLRRIRQRPRLVPALEIAHPASRRRPHRGWTESYPSDSRS